tara:strand:+ start:1999 stop:4104 length:2106 start_codon:yes stop_codon:yes gene_type:complete
MAENGILDYQGMNQAIYRGATSNIVVDTQSMSIEIGAGNTSHTSNLHFECNHDANVASIKLNSNVVTEFPRSKKLIKYPRVAMTQNDESGTSGYVASANSEYHNDYAAFRAFNTKGPGYNHGATIGWEPANISTFNSSGTWVGSTSSSVNTTMTLDDGNTIYGEWLQIQLPTKIRLEYVNFLILSGSAHAMAHRAPRAGYILGSNNGTNWTALKNWSGIVFDTWTAYYHKFYKFDIDKEVDNYQYFRFVWTETAGTSSLSEYASGQELEFWGVPEYDPEAHGTDVTIKSKANAPNTDWLEVYYDAKNYTNGVVQDETANNRDGTLYGNTSLNSSDGIHKFDFDGNGDYIKTTLTGFTGTTVTFSAWVFMDSIDMTRAQTIMGLGSWGVAGSAAWIAVGTGGILETGNKSITSCGSPVQANTLTGRWLHITGIVSSGDFRFYQDGQLIKSLTTTGTINYGTNPVLYIATRADSSGNPEATRYFDCKIANARLFNRALTTDEVWQLYAYQKEYFGHGDLGMTLKAGRLGIGTSEPRAALDINSGGVRLNQELWVTPAKINDTVRVSTNTLSFYEEGSWTPTLGAVTAPTYTEQFGYYTRIGNIVHLVFRISVTGLDNGDGSGIHITLPYELANNNGHSAMCSFGYNNSLFDPALSNGGANIGNNYIIPARGGSGQTAVSLRYNNCFTSGTLLGFATYSLQVTK